MFYTQRTHTTRYGGGEQNLATDVEVSVNGVRCKPYCDSDQHSPSRSLLALVGESGLLD